MIVALLILAVAVVGVMAAAYTLGMLILTGGAGSWRR